MLPAARHAYIRKANDDLWPPRVTQCAAFGTARGGCPLASRFVRGTFPEAPWLVPKE
jgi:hypothetical protein